MNNTPPPLPASPPKLPATPDPDRALLRMAIPIDRSGVAIAAGYLALFSLLPPVAPFALAMGILALRHIKKNPGLRGKGRAWFAIIMGGLITALLLLVVAAMVISSVFVK